MPDPQGPASELFLRCDRCGEEIHKEGLQQGESATDLDGLTCFAGSDSYPDHRCYGRLRIVRAESPQQPLVAEEGVPLPGRDVTYRRVQLDQIRMAFSLRVSRELLNHTMTLKEYGHWIEIAIEGALWGRRDLRSYTFEAPADWWQAVRQRWFPRTWLRRHPVIMRRQKVSLHDLYPTIKTVVPGHQNRLVLEVRDEKDTCAIPPA